MLKVEKTVKLPKEFETKGNMDILSQAIHVYRSRSHFGVAKVKGRGEVARTTKKVYKQKGTGGARHGARSAPIFVGGGVTFGPRVAKTVLRLSSALKKTSLATALTLMAKEGKVVVVSGFSTVKSTKEVAALLSKLEGKRFVVALSGENADKIRFIRNIKGVEVVHYQALNAHLVIFGGTLVIDSSVFAKEKEAPKTVVKVDTKTVKKVATKKVVKKGSK